MVLYHCIYFSGIHALFFITFTSNNYHANLEVLIARYRVRVHMFIGVSVWECMSVCIGTIQRVYVHVWFTNFFLWITTILSEWMLVSYTNQNGLAISSCTKSYLSFTLSKWLVLHDYWNILVCNHHVLGF